MVRTAAGRTYVTVHAEGLLPNTTYPSHVHALPCGQADADGHYRRDPAGPATPPNEIWQGFTTDADGVGNGRAVADYTAGAERGLRRDPRAGRRQDRLRRPSSSSPLEPGGPGGISPGPAVYPAAAARRAAHSRRRIERLITKTHAGSSSTTQSQMLTTSSRSTPAA